MSKNKSVGEHYNDYLQLDKIVNSQNLTGEDSDDYAHDEMLFIVIHQAYELWFKQIIHELFSIQQMFSEDSIPESNVGLATRRLRRIRRILKILIQQIDILETMTSAEFLKFRNRLFPASGFQSYQFRVLEHILGLQDDKRPSISANYQSAFTEKQLLEFKSKYLPVPTLKSLIEKWLERLADEVSKNFDFTSNYSKSVDQYIESELLNIKNSNLIDSEKINRSNIIEKSRDIFKVIFDADFYKENRDNGSISFSQKSLIGALFINLYNDLPILKHPFSLIEYLIDIDELLTNWRYRHAQMVLRIIGKRIGTGGSSGYDYLIKTVQKSQVFGELNIVSSMLIPKEFLPKLPSNLIAKLNFN